jgi:chitinase
MPADQITLGVPAYGYLSASWNDNLRTRDLPAQNILGGGYPLEADMQVLDSQIGMRQRSRRALEKRYVTVNSGWSTSEGQVMWHDLVSQGALAKGSDGKWIGAGGFERKWDQCSSTVSQSWFDEQV